MMILFGDFAPHIGMIAKSGVVFLIHVGHTGRRAMVRRNLNKRLPDVRLHISGEHYVH
jgi:hypothetical protein